MKQDKFLLRVSKPLMIKLRKQASELDITVTALINQLLSSHFNNLDNVWKGNTEEPEKEDQ